MIISKANTPAWYANYDRIFGKDQKPEVRPLYQVKYWSDEDDTWVFKTAHKNLAWAVMWEDTLRAVGKKTKIIYKKKIVSEEEKNNARENYTV